MVSDLTDGHRALDGWFWPIAARRDFPKADTRAAGFGKSSRSAWVATKGQSLSLRKYEKVWDFHT
ncbi:MAG: hypothetical protein WBM88_10365, partial [Woeseiaceae bacterium]